MYQTLKSCHAFVFAWQHDHAGAGQAAIWSDPDFLDHLIGRNNALGVCHGETEAIQCGVQAAGIAES
jgi:hypothetical protein